MLVDLLVEFELVFGMAFRTTFVNGLGDEGVVEIVSGVEWSDGVLGILRKHLIDDFSVSEDEVSVESDG